MQGLVTELSDLSPTRETERPHRQVTEGAADPRGTEKPPGLVHVNRALRRTAGHSAVPRERSPWGQF